MMGIVRCSQIYLFLPVTQLHDSRRQPWPQKLSCEEELDQDTTKWAKISRPHTTRTAGTQNLFCVGWQDYIVQDLSDSLRILPSRAVYRSRWRVVYADLPQLCLFLNILFQLPSSKARPAAHKLSPIQSQREVLVGLIVMSSAWFPFRKIDTNIE